MLWYFWFVSFTFVTKVNMAGRIDQIEQIHITVFGFVVNACCLQFYCYTTLSFNVHIIQQLCLHVS